MAFNSPELSARDGAPENRAAKLDDSAFAVLPYVPAEWLDDAFSRHVPADLELVLRYKIVPVSWIPSLVLHAVVTQEALRQARRLGLKAVARISPASYRAAVRRHHGRLLLHKAVLGLAKMQPELSARRRLSGGQKAIITGFAAGAAALALLEDFRALAFAASLAGMLFFTLVVAVRVFCLLPSPRALPGAAPPLPEETLPTYSVLVPLFRETAVLDQLFRALLSLDYPPDRLDIKLILEEEDTPMHRAVAGLALPPHFEVIVVPGGKPQTKPRALNYALQFARGSLVTIYDAEDIPDWQQLRQAAAAFHAAPADLACLQAGLAFYNPGVNWLTRQFAAEYAALFKVMLPALAERELPILLGGTSNHFRRRCLEAAGAWDAFNVTEDADLGLRLARLGYGCGVLASDTLEEANMELGNWLKQRRRWLKGFLQTWLVHMRAPFQLSRDLGAGGFWIAQCLTLGVFGSALLHPLLLAFGIWSLLPGNMARLPNALPAHLAAGAALAILIGGYAAAMTLAAKGLSRQGLKRRWPVIATLPIYWLLMSVAAWQALWDFIVRPFHWHKTRHGISAVRTSTRPGAQQRR